MPTVNKPSNRALSLLKSSRDACARNEKKTTTDPSDLYKTKLKKTLENLYCDKGSTAKSTTHRGTKRARGLLSQALTSKSLKKPKTQANSEGSAARLSM